MFLSDDSNHFSVEKSFRIKQDDRFFTRLMSKETSNNANTSSRVLYYGEASLAVPFIWEAQPGTPKHPLSETSLPPLTPPPSYYSNSYKSNSKGRNSKANIFSSILLRFAGSKKGTHVSPSSSWSPSNSSLSAYSTSCSLAYSSSSPSVSMRQGSLSRSPSSSVESPMKHKGSNGFLGCYPFGNMKNATVSH